MQVYIIEFERYPHLLKIGMAKSTKSRLQTLRISHGKEKAVKVFSGKLYKQAERILHEKLSNYRTRISGDGGTEFFSKELNMQEIEKILYFCEMKEVQPRANHQKAKKVEKIYKWPSYEDFLVEIKSNGVFDKYWQKIKNATHSGSFVLEEDFENMYQQIYRELYEYAKPLNIRVEYNLNNKLIQYFL